jgi:hypothetical protein
MASKMIKTESIQVIRRHPQGVKKHPTGMKKATLSGHHMMIHHLRDIPVK